MMTKSAERMLSIETEGICTCVTQLSKSCVAISSNELIEIWDLR